MILTDIYISLQFALVAWTIRHILMRPGMIFHRYFLWLDSMVGKNKEWLAKPLGYCDRCFAGQLALWGFFLLHLTEYSPALFFRHLVFICLTVFIVYQMQRLIHDN